MVITGTDKDDLFEIIREDNKTIIRVSRIKKGTIAENYKERVFDPRHTNEIWIYGLDDDDKFVVKGRLLKYAL